MASLFRNENKWKGKESVDITPVVSTKTIVFASPNIISLTKQNMKAVSNLISPKCNRSAGIKCKLKAATDYFESFLGKLT